jgi:hypothetical protein
MERWDRRDGITESLRALRSVISAWCAKRRTSFVFDRPAVVITADPSKIIRATEIWISPVRQPGALLMVRIANHKKDDRALRSQRIRHWPDISGRMRTI